MGKLEVKGTFSFDEFEADEKLYLTESSGKPTNSRYLNSLRSLNKSLLSVKSVRSDISASVTNLTDLPPLAADEDAEDEAVKPPDGGFGWVVVGASFLAGWLVGGMFLAFSIFYVEWTDYFQADKGVTGWIGSLNMSTGTFLGELRT